MTSITKTQAAFRQIGLEEALGSHPLYTVLCESAEMLREQHQKASPNTYSDDRNWGLEWTLEVLRSGRF